MKRILSVYFLLGLTSALAFGCKSASKSAPATRPVEPGHGASGDDDAIAEPHQRDDSVKTITSCGSLGRRACARLEECAPFLLQTLYGERGACEDLFGGICDSMAGAETPIAFDRCTTALDSCGSFVEARGVPLACFKPVGRAELGDACLADHDCGAGLCSRGKGDQAGRCAKPAGLGEECSPPTRCAQGLRCSPVDYSCVAQVPDGEGCNTSFDCQLGSKCTDDSVCAPTALGDACAAGTLPCNTGLGQTCLFDHCSALVVADSDSACLLGNAECEGTKRCRVKQLANLERSAACVETAGLGAACDADLPCLEPLSCRNGACTP